MAPIKVLHLIDSPNRRGAELFALDLAAHLGGTEFKSLVVSLFRPEPGTPMTSPLLRRLDSRPGALERALGLNWWLLARLARVATRHRADVVISHGGATLRYAAALSVFRPGSKLIYRCIGTPSYWVDPGPRARVTGRLLGRASAVVCTNEHDLRDLVQLFGQPRCRVHVVDNGIDLRRARAADGAALRSRVRKCLGVPEDATLLITVGHLAAEKNHRALFPVLSGLARQGIEARAVIVGDGPMRGPLMAQAVAAGLKSVVVFVGERQGVADLLAAADVFALPSLTEGMPAALIEAGVAGLPVVSFDVGGVPELIRPGVDGYVVPVGDVAGMTSKIAYLARRKALARHMGLEARRQWTERFDIRRIAREYAALIRQTAETRAA